LAEAHLAGAKSVAAALNTFTFVLSVGGGVILLAILWEAAAWRRLVWHVVKDAGVVESSEWREMVRGVIPHWIGRR